MTTANANANEFNNIHDMAQEMVGESGKDKTEFEPISNHSFWLQVAGYMILLFVVGVAITYGMQYGVGYVTSLALSEMLTAIATISVKTVAAALMLITQFSISAKICKLFIRKIMSKAAK